ncbi:fluoride efflux transporter FluC [Cellulomonas dongxiuzhuiae]|uniref:fluoride efflux transporter FluC n=1 Tax=Cellulomonas dongxiuzhuiae TaxID=2819979 RepID=UPI001AAFF3D1|nr:CrcB family protein [Cellulomonas dongxiuzhuiae]MBO3089723.1 CrcB family protein [Cellulomonas dongxiuzhuiae]
MIVAVALAGGLGAASRLLVDTWVSGRTRAVPRERTGARRARPGVPLGTLVVNVTACLLLGALTGWLLAHPGHDDVRGVLGVGFLGGYSTFSTASVEAVRLLLAGRGAAGALHALGMLAACVTATTVGLALTSP